MRINHSLRAILFFFSLFVFSCQPEPDNKAENILGRWVLEDATRNGRPTESLAELYFEFFQDGNMRTNLSGSVENASYHLEGGQLLQRDSRLEADYRIEELSDSTLILITELRGYSFRFKLNKSVQEE